jgi:5-formyltetrahydrofolate cyclo-ligase
MTKSELRKIYKSLRKKLSETELQSQSIALANQLLTLKIWEANFFHLFLTIEKQKEIDTTPLLTLLSGKDKHIVISKSDFSTRDMTHFLLTDSTLLQLNSWGIPEPEKGVSISEQQIEVVFIPLLAFDLEGHRVGYGQGFYDQFLKKCSKSTLKIGLSFFEAEPKIDDIEPHDIRLDYCVTPEKIYKF